MCLVCPQIAALTVSLSWVSFKKSPKLPEASITLRMIYVLPQPHRTAVSNKSSLSAIANRARKQAGELHCSFFVTDYRTKKWSHRRRSTGAVITEWPTSAGVSSKRAGSCESRQLSTQEKEQKQRTRKLLGQTNQDPTASRHLKPAGNISSCQ